MISAELYSKLLNDNLSLDHFNVLKSLYNNEELPDNRRVQGFINLLIKRGYIEDGILTEKGIDLVQESIPEGIIVSTVSCVPSYTENNKDLGNWVRCIRTKCQEKLLELKGSKQVRDRIKGTAYSFLPNELDLAKKLIKVITLYKLSDLDRIERTILAYIDRCHKQNSWFPVLEYYIYKDGKSALVTDMETIDEDSKEENNFSSEVCL